MNTQDENDEQSQEVVLPYYAQKKTKEQREMELRLVKTLKDRAIQTLEHLCSMDTLSFALDTPKWNKLPNGSYRYARQLERLSLISEQLTAYVQAAIAEVHLADSAKGLTTRPVFEQICVLTGRKFYADPVETDQAGASEPNVGMGTTGSGATVHETGDGFCKWLIAKFEEAHTFQSDCDKDPSLILSEYGLNWMKASFWVWFLPLFFNEMQQGLNMIEKGKFQGVRQKGSLGQIVKMLKPGEDIKVFISGLESLTLYSKAKINAEDSASNWTSLKGEYDRRIYLIENGYAGKNDLKPCADWAIKECLRELKEAQNLFDVDRLERSPLFKEFLHSQWLLYFGNIVKAHKWAPVTSKPASVATDDYDYSDSDKL